MKMKKGFTLAEVLITLGIIGVIAAMTIPTLLQNTNSAKFTAQFKKTLSTLSQAALMGQAQYDTDFSMTRVACTKGATASLTGSGDYELSFCGLFNSTLAGYSYVGVGTDTAADANNVKLTDKAGKTYSWNDVATGADGETGKGVLKASDLNNMIIYSLADGSIFGFNKEAKACSLPAGDEIAKDGKLNSNLEKCTGFIDVNGTSAPNVEVKCSGTTTTGEGTSAKTEANKTTWGTSGNCQVAKGASLGDVFPVVFHDGTVEPATNAAKAVLLQGK